MPRLLRSLNGLRPGPPAPCACRFPPRPSLPVLPSAPAPAAAEAEGQVKKVKYG